MSPSSLPPELQLNSAPWAEAQGARLCAATPSRYRWAIVRLMVDSGALSPGSDRWMQESSLRHEIVAACSDN